MSSIDGAEVVRTPSRITGSSSGSSRRAGSSRRPEHVALRSRATPASARERSPFPPRASPPAVRRTRSACRPTRRRRVGRHAHLRPDAERVDRRAGRARAPRPRARPGRRSRRSGRAGEPGLVQQRARAARTARRGRRCRAARRSVRSSPRSRITSIAVSTPFSVSYVSTRNVVRLGKSSANARNASTSRRERLDVGVRHRAGDREAVPPRGLDVRVAANPTIALARATAMAASTPVRAPEREVHEVLAGRGHRVARGLRRERRVERHLVQQERLHQLRDGDRRGDLHDRLVRVHDPAFGDRPDLSVEPQLAERPRCRVRRTRSSAGTRARPRRTRTTRGVEAGLETRRDQEAAVRRQVADVEAERRRSRHVAAEIARGHVELVEVRQERARHPRRLHTDARALRPRNGSWSSPPRRSMACRSGSTRRWTTWRSSSRICLLRTSPGSSGSITVYRCRNEGPTTPGPSRPHHALSCPDRADARGSEERLRRIIAHTVAHEVAHHFGISDDRLREIGAY